MTARKVPRCPGCGNRIDPQWCHCGDSEASHRGMNQNHGFVPAGCTCGYVKSVRKVPGYSKAVRQELDEARPAYTDLVKLLAALSADEKMFELLVSKVKEACDEAVRSER